MNNIMVDLETLGTNPGSIILSIGAVFFDPVMGMGEEFYSVISKSSSEECGLKSDPKTLKWWSEQTKEARTVLEESERSSISLPQALVDFSAWSLRNNHSGDIRIWGNGADFDNVLLRGAYAICNLPAPWSYGSNRCFRTLKSFAPNIELIRAGTYHNALDDAKTQAAHASKVLNSLRLATPVAF